MEGLNVILGLIFILGFIWYITGGDKEGVMVYAKVFLGGFFLFFGILWILFQLFG